MVNLPGPGKAERVPYLEQVRQRADLFEFAGWQIAGLEGPVRQAFQPVDLFRS